VAYYFVSKFYKKGLRVKGMDAKERLDLITRPPTEEVLTKQDLAAAIEMGLPLKHYVGFEVSGRMHIGSGLMMGRKIADFQEAGVKCSCFLADLHTLINGKLGGDLDVIRRTAAGYFKEALKVSVYIAGGHPEEIKFNLGSEIYDEHKSDFLIDVIDVARNISLGRAKRTITIMGRKEGEAVNFAQLMYPPMQVADIFIQGINLMHAGMDQRKAHVVAREVAPKLKFHPLTKKVTLRGRTEEQVYKPIAVHHHLVLGLGTPPVWPMKPSKIRDYLSELKMSKSVPKTCVFLTDTPQDIEAKLMGAFCPAGEVVYNPVLDWCKHIVFNLRGELTIERPSKYGGNIHFHSYEDLENVFKDGKLHPVDLKRAVSTAIADILKPARKQFERPKFKKMLQEVKELNITR